MSAVHSQSAHIQVHRLQHGSYSPQRPSAAFYKEYIELLNGDKLPSEKFWELEKRIKNDKKSAGVMLEMTRSQFIRNIIYLIDDGAITFDDLKEFSDELKESVGFFIDKK